VELRTALDDALDLLKPDLAGRVEVVRHYAPDVPPVLGHPGPLGQVFLNLLKNASQAVTGEGGRKPRIDVELSGSDGTVRVAVTDNGPGIPPEALPKIFEPFFTTKPVGQGTGLGLSICHGIVEKHGGKIEVASEPGKTTFAVTLPARP
jgi:two-component system NtrC family sensor kinase